MTSHDLNRSLPSLLRELVHGAGDAGFILNPHDVGLLATLDRLSAEDASASTNGGATIAAHVAHVTYGLSLMNRWAAGEDPFASTDWSGAWKVTTVADAGWARLRHDLREQADRWLHSLASPREISGVEIDGVIASIAHLAYHLGAIRQIQASARGPKEGG
jgi:hypothetical protein